ncbi:sigma factor, partial [Clostridioides difficile]
EAKEILISSNLGLVRSVVSRFLNIGYDREDLFQLGSIGLIKSHLMGEGLQKSAGTKLKKIIKLLTSNLFMGVLVGTGVTAVIQSS